MSITSMTKDPEALTMTVVAEYDVPAERAWQLWSDPRQLERWWGPPVYPAAVEHHDLTPGGRVTYVMTGPGGDQHHGWWRVLEVDAPRLLVVEDGFAHDTGEVNVDMPTTIMRVRIDDRPAGGVSIVVETTFPSIEVLDQLVAMGMEEGLRGAMGQIDAILAG